MVKNLPANAGDTGCMHLIPVLARSPGEGNGNPLQCSCLENPRDGGAWWAAVCGVAQSRTRLKQLSSSSLSIHDFEKSFEKKFFNVVTALKINFSVENDSHFITDIYGTVSFDQ